MREQESLSEWRWLRATSGFLATVGPIRWRECGGDLELGFRVDAMHCNPIGYCHGGMLATFADIVLGFGVGHAVANGAFMPTIALTVDFLAPTPQGSWLSGRAEMLRLGRRIEWVVGQRVAFHGCTSLRVPPVVIHPARRS